MAMNQHKNEPSQQVQYLGRWVDKNHFSAFIFDGKEQRLVRNYEEFTKLLGSGLWFATKEDADKSIIVPEVSKEETIFVKHKLKLAPKQEK